MRAARLRAPRAPGADGSGGGDPVHWLPVSFIASLNTAIASLPALLTAALAVQISSEFTFPEGRLGLLLACYFMSAAVASWLLGGVSERIGPVASIKVASFGTAVTLVVMATMVDGYGALIVVLAVGGVFPSLASPAANLLIVRAVPVARQGVALAIKQSGMPVSAIISGAAASMVGTGDRWRVAFICGAVLAAGAAMLLPADPPRTEFESAPRRSSRRPEPFGSLVIMTAAGLIGGGVSGSVTGFLVVGGVDAGLSTSEAGLLLVAGSLSAIVVRVVLGLRADRRGSGHLLVVATMMALGSIAYVGFGVGGTWPFLLATPLAFAAGWGWTGLFNLAVVQSFARSPGRASGIMQGGMYAGAVVGPLLFGLTAEVTSFRVSWIGTAVASGLAAVLIILARRRLATGQADVVATTQMAPG